MQYEFNIGDEVITSDGDKGVIIDICTCSECEKRGFYDLKWQDEYGETDHITSYSRKNGFKYFYKIGKYRFGNLEKDLVEYHIFRHETDLARLKKQLEVIEELERGDSNAGEK